MSGSLYRLCRYSFVNLSVSAFGGPRVNYEVCMQSYACKVFVRRPTLARGGNDLGVDLRGRWVGGLSGIRSCTLQALLNTVAEMEVSLNLSRTCSLTYTILVCECEMLEK